MQIHREIADTGILITNSSFTPQSFLFLFLLILCYVSLYSVHEAQLLEVRRQVDRNRFIIMIGIVHFTPESAYSSNEVRRHCDWFRWCLSDKSFYPENTALEFVLLSHLLLLKFPVYPLTSI